MNQIKKRRKLGIFKHIIVKSLLQTATNPHQNYSFSNSKKVKKILVTN